MGGFTRRRDQPTTEGTPQPPVADDAVRVTVEVADPADGRRIEAILREHGGP